MLENIYYDVMAWMEITAAKTGINIVVLGIFMGIAGYIAFQATKRILSALLTVLAVLAAYLIIVTYIL